MQSKLAGMPDIVSKPGIPLCHIIAEPKMAKAITIIAITVLSNPQPNPVRMTVAGPVLVDLAISFTGPCLSPV
jgi:hypothetical protein